MGRADGSKLVATQTLDRGGLWLAPTSNPDSAQQITPGTTRWDAVGLSWIGNAQIVYGYIGGDKFRIARLEIPSGQPTDLHLPGEALLYPASCNGSIVYEQGVKQNFSIWHAELNGGTPRALDSGPTTGFPVCTPDGKLVIYDRVEGEETRLMRVPATGGTPQKLNDLDVRFPSMSPDGRQVAAFYFTDPAAVPKLAVLPVEGGAPAQVIDMPNNLDFRFPTSAGFGWMPDGHSVIFPVTEKGVTNLWVQPLGAIQGKLSPPHQWTHFSANGVYRFAISPGGKQVVLARAADTSDMVLITRLP